MVASWPRSTPFDKYYRNSVYDDRVIFKDTEYTHTIENRLKGHLS